MKALRNLFCRHDWRWTKEGVPIKQRLWVCLKCPTRKIKHKNHWYWDGNEPADELLREEEYKGERIYFANSLWYWHRQGEIVSIVSNASKSRIKKMIDRKDGYPLRQAIKRLLVKLGW